MKKLLIVVGSNNNMRTNTFMHFCAGTCAGFTPASHEGWVQ